MDGFELFDNNSISRVVDKITITKNYSINFPSAFYKINGLSDERSVLLYYNKETNQIGIEFKKELDDRGFKITNSGDGNTSGYITAKNFFALNGLIGNVEPRRYEYEKILRDSMENTCSNHFFVVKLEHKN